MTLEVASNNLELVGAWGCLGVGSAVAAGAAVHSGEVAAQPGKPRVFHFAQLLALKPHADLFKTRQGQQHIPKPCEV